MHLLLHMYYYLILIIAFCWFSFLYFSKNNWFTFFSPPNCIRSDIKFQRHGGNPYLVTHIFFLKCIVDMVHLPIRETWRQRNREGERPHISLMPFSKHRSKSHTSSGHGGKALDEFSPCLLTPPPTLCQAVQLCEREEERETMTRAEQQRHCSPPAPVFIPAWALDVITAQRSTLTETESSQRQQEWVRDIKRQRARESTEEKRSTALSFPAMLLQWYKSAPCCFWCLGVKHTHTHTHTCARTLWNPATRVGLHRTCGGIPKARPSIWLCGFPRCVSTVWVCLRHTENLQNRAVTKVT